MNLKRNLGQILLASTIGFGLVALHVKFNMDEKKGSTDPIEDLIRNTEGVESVEVIAISRAFG